MSWKSSSIIKERERFAILAFQKKHPFAELCRQFGISRQVGYKWRGRFAVAGRRGLQDHRRGPKQPMQPQAQRWRRRALGLRRAHRHWGGAKIRVKLAEKYGRRRLPAVRTLERWFVQAGLSKKRPRRARQGPAVVHPGLTCGRRPHQVWTVDFKGWYRTADGQRQEPLTIREMWSRYVLAIRLLPDQSDTQVRRAFGRVFAQHGLPKIIRVDNGSPFAGLGALRLTRLSVWWLRLGIRVEFTRRARPGDNAAHEQMHGLYAREVAADPGANRRSEQRRAERWRRQYNEQRPHAALRQQPPGVRYTRSSRAYPSQLAEWGYPPHWNVRRVRSHGDIKWQGRLRFIGRAFVGERVGLKVLGTEQWAVYLGTLLIGHLHAKEASGLRPAFWQRPPAKRKTKPATQRGAPRRKKFQN
jgi:transposase InsO family protein